MRRLALALAAMALPAAAVAQAPLCLPEYQAAAVVTFVLPSLVTGLAHRCGPTLPPDAYLTANAGALADRYRPDADYAWPTARAAIARLFTQFLGQKMPDEMNSDVVRQLAEPLIGNLLAKQVHTGDCATADAAVATLAPLSGRDVGRLAALGAAIADRKDKGIAGILHICRPETAR